MTELDLEIPGLATELIEEFGKVLGYVQRGEGTYNPATSMADAPENPVDIKGIVEPYKGQRMMAGLVEAGDLKVTAARESFDQFEEPPTTGDVIFIDTMPHNVMNVMATYSGELIAIYELQVRAG